MMRTFSLLTNDTRYRVPTLTLILAEDEARAIALAYDNLSRSEFHTAVEIQEGDNRLYRVTRDRAAADLSQSAP
jgi:hypothetical protein